MTTDAERYQYIKRHAMWIDVVIGARPGVSYDVFSFHYGSPNDSEIDAAIDRGIAWEQGLKEAKNANEVREGA